MAVAALTISIVACGTETVTTATTSVETTSYADSMKKMVPASPDDLAAFERVDIALGGEKWTVAVADTRSLRSQGLMGVTELKVDGMLFIFESSVQVSFHMQDTLIPLDIAFFADDGSLVDRFTMTPCNEVPCPIYPAAGPARYAIETTAGGFGELDSLVLDVASGW